MSERPVLVGLIPQAVVLDPGDTVSWISDAGNLKVEFDANRCPFASNIFQAPVGMRLLSGPVTPGIKGGKLQVQTLAQRADDRPRRGHCKRAVVKQRTAARKKQKRWHLAERRGQYPEKVNYAD